ncbi:MAG: DNA-formamidopyrimidine glycosylase family protein [Actinomycetota bacterium]
MPEGDTIHRVVNRLRPMLEGERVTRLAVTRLTGPLPQVGEIVDDVRAVGKHLVVDFSGGLSIRVHLRMTGSWHAYRPGQRWTKAPSTARVVIGTGDWIAVCFNAPDVTVGSDPDAELTHLGPDLCLPDADIDAAVARFDRFLDPATPIGVALLDQRVAAGIGNVYKCDVLHLRGVDPARALGDIPVDERRALLALASELLLANLGAGARQTVPEGLAVYGREGERCRRCGVTIERFRQGADQPRSTWWCRGCQT